jgi:hypothetical protein
MPPSACTVSTIIAAGRSMPLPGASISSSTVMVSISAPRYPYKRHSDHEFERYARRAALE